jgi:hypothetical protein
MTKPDEIALMWKEINGKTAIYYSDEEEQFYECQVRAHADIGISIIPHGEDKDVLDGLPAPSRFFVCTVEKEKHPDKILWMFEASVGVAYLHNALDKGEIITDIIPGHPYHFGVCPFSHGG